MLQSHIRFDRASAHSLPAMLLLAAATLLPLSGTAETPRGWGHATLEWQYYAYGAAYDGGGSPTTCQVKLNDCGQFYSYFEVQPNATSITFNYSPSGSGGTWSPSVLSLPPTIYNGIAINLMSRGKIKSVTIDPATNMVGFDTSHLSFTAKQIQVDWQNLSYNSSTIVKLDVKFSKGSEPQGTLVGNPPRPSTE